MRYAILLFAFTAASLFAQGQKAEAMSDPKYGDAAAIRALPLAKLNALVADREATPYAKAKACQRLAVIGDRTSVPAVAPLLSDEHLAVYARTALEQIPGDAATDALLAALQKLSGKQLIGVINSLGVRRDPRAVDALSRLLKSDAEVAQAASVALAKIRPPL
jgi:HEAT repeat protein